MQPLHLTLRQLQIFDAVARCGSTLAAGAQIALSQSATSAAVQELERLLGRKLFDRTGRRLVLNDAGRSLLPRARALLDGAGAIEEMQGDAGGDPLQALRIGASTTLGSYVLPRILRSMMDGPPRSGGAGEWRTRVAIGNTAEICKALAQFELDIGLIEGPCHEPALEVTPWIADEMRVVADPQSVYARREGGRQANAPLALRDLRNAVWLVREQGSGTREATDRLLLPHLRGYRRVIELGSSEAIKQAAAAGLGLACLSQWVVEDLLQSGRLVPVATRLPRLARQCYVVVHRDKHTTPALERFWKAVLPPPPPPRAARSPGLRPARATARKQSAGR